MKKLTKKSAIEFMRFKLSTDDVWAHRALIKLLQQQTKEEVETEHSLVVNKVGFSGMDDKILTSIALQAQRTKRLSSRQYQLLHRLLPKYAAQLYSFSDRQILEKAYCNCTEWQKKLKMALNPEKIQLSLF